MERRRTREVNPARVYRERDRSVHRPSCKQNRHTYISMPQAAENSTFASENNRPQYSSVRSFPPPPPPPPTSARRVYTPLFKPQAEPSLSEEEEEDYQCVAHHEEEERSSSEDELGFPHDYYPVRKCVDTRVLSPVASFRTQVLCDHCARKTVAGHNSVPKNGKYYSTL